MRRNLRCWRTIGVAVLAVGPAALAAQDNRISSPSTAPVIRHIVIDRAEVFDSSEARRFWGFALVNAVHAQTRPWVIRRELLFETGEPLDTARLNESARNLRALGIFRDVTIDTVATDSGLTVRVRTTDGWTTNLGFGIRTSGSQRVINAFIQETNLLGTRTIATLGFEDDPDRSTVVVGLDAPRLVARRVGIGASYSQRSDGHAAGAVVRHPFFSLASRAGGSLSWGSFDGRVLRYAEGALVDSARRKYALVRADGAIAARASAHGYVRLGLTGQLQRDDFGPEGGTADLPRTIRIAAGPYVAARRAHYIQVRNFEAMGRIEDVDLGPSVRADVALAPSAWGYDRDGVGGSIAASVGTRFPTGFAQAGASAGGLRTSVGTDSSSLDLSALAVSQPDDRHLLVAHATVGRLNDPPFGAYYDLGLGYGVRAFRSHAFTGDRYYLLNGEYRWLALPRVLDLVGLGVAGFVDHGGAWFRGAERRTGTDAGIGLRIGSIRSAGSIIGRLDLAYRWKTDREPGGWIVSLGRGFGWQRF